MNRNIAIDIDNKSLVEGIYAKIDGHQTFKKFTNIHLVIFKNVRKS